jgi:hypothetical protein
MLISPASQGYLFLDPTLRSGATSPTRDPCAQGDGKGKGRNEPMGCRSSYLLCLTEGKWDFLWGRIRWRRGKSSGVERMRLEFTTGPYWRLELELELKRCEFVGAVTSNETGGYRVPKVKVGVGLTLLRKTNPA